jgi:hypothetical protein
MMTESVEINVTRVHVNRIYLLLNVVFDGVQVPYVNGNCSRTALHFTQNSANSKFKMDCSSQLQMQMLCT